MFVIITFGLKCHLILSEICDKSGYIKVLLHVVVQQSVEALLESGYSLLKEQQLVMETRLSKEYMKNMDG
jgi:hypothetical protein